VTVRQNQEPASSPPLNISQDDDNFYFRAEVPGIKPAELSISALRNRGSVDPEGIDARYAEGVLTLALPKAEQTKPRQIAVRT
jgi:HSP20 family protein